MKKIIEDILYKDLSYQIHGAAIEVRKDFGSGHKEKLYQEALARELRIGASVVVLLASISLTLAFFSGLKAQAADLRVYFSTPSQIAAGQEFSVKVLIDTDIPTNAYEIKLVYPRDVLDFVRFDNNGSFVDIWQKQSNDSGIGEVALSGASFSPFMGNGGKVATLNFRASKEGGAELGFIKAEAYLADGEGTVVSPNGERVMVRVLAPGDVSTGIDVENAVPLAVINGTSPQIKTASLTADPFNENQKLFGFLAVSGGSGIKTTEARTRKYIFWGEWAEVRNPVAVPASVWSIALRVTDNNGNVAERIVYDWRALVKLAVFVVGSISAAVIVLVVVRRRAIIR